MEGRPLLLRHLWQRLLVQLVVKLLVRRLRVYQWRVLLWMQGGLRSPLRLVAAVLAVHAAVLCNLMQGRGGDAVGLEGLVEDRQTGGALW